MNADYADERAVDADRAEEKFHLFYPRNPRFDPRNPRSNAFLGAAAMAVHVGVKCDRWIER